MRDILRRVGWALLALLFIVTGLGVGVYAFWQSTHQNNNSTKQQANLNCTSAAAPLNQKPAPAKLKGTKLADFKPVSKINDLQCIDFKLGSGGVAQSSSIITVNYTGAVAATGVIFESSFDQAGKPLTTSLNQIIPGWTQGIPGMKVGGVRRLLVPAALGYGAQARPGIPPNSDLVFDLTLLDAQ